MIDTAVPFCCQEYRGRLALAMAHVIGNCRNMLADLNQAMTALDEDQVIHVPGRRQLTRAQKDAQRIELRIQLMYVQGMIDAMTKTHLICDETLNPQPRTAAAPEVAAAPPTPPS